MIFAAMACALAMQEAPGFADAVPVPQEEYATQLVASGLSYPWAVAEIPNGDLLIAERGGDIRIVRDGRLLAETVVGVPDAFVSGQAGLFDLVPHPDVVSNAQIYFTYATGTSSRNTLRLARAVYRPTATGGLFEEVETLFDAEAYRSTDAHYGGRLVFLDDGTLLLTSGEGYAYRAEAQKLDTHFGKVLRLTEDGEAAPGNPFEGREGALPEIWSYGHRNPQGIDIAPDGTVYANEHGARGGDEVNIIEPGLNYGWPLTTYGVDYSGAQITPFKVMEGTAQPLFHWTPSIAPSSLEYIESDALPFFRGRLVSGALAGREVRVADPRLATAEQRTLLSVEGDRIRDVHEAADGSLLVLTEDPGDGQLLRIIAAD